MASGRRQNQPVPSNATKANHLTASQRAGGEMILGRGRGCGMAVVTEALPDRPAAGSFGWIGGYGSSWISDPSRDLTMILLTQHEFSSAGGDLTTRAGSFTTPRPAAPRGVSFERVPCSLHSTH